ncbi:MAG: zinc transporter substrate-binding protein [Cryobacterium sp.]|nr:zinc transporter substrate-binding protein [Cryobacterium sp.]
MRAPSSRRTPSHRNRSLALTLALGLGARAGCTPATADRPLIVVTTNILGDVVENIVGDQVEVMTLMRPNSDPHSFEISAQEAARILSADLVISNGLGPEEGLQKQLDSATDAGVPMLAAGEIIETLAYTSTASDTGADDPHFWTDPERMLDVVAAVTGAVRDEVAGVDTGAIDQSAAAYTAELEALDTEMTDRFAGIRAERRNLVTNHHVFGYLADRFDFTVVGAVIPGGSTLAAPSASDLRSLVDAIDTAGVPTIFA